MRKLQDGMVEILVIFLLIFTPLAYGAVQVWSITVLHAVSVAIFAAWTLPMIRKGRLTFYRTPVDLPLLIFFSLAFLSVFISVYPYASRIQICQLFNYAFIFYIVTNTAREKNKLTRLAWTIVLFGAFYAAAGMVLVGGKFLGFRIFSPDHYSISLTFVNRNHFAGYLEMVACLCLGLALAYKGARRILFLCLGAYTAVAVVFSLSRGGAFGLVGGLCFMSFCFVLCKKRSKNILVISCFFAAVVAIMTLLGIQPVSDRLETLIHPDILEVGRLHFWKDSLRMIADRPWFGWGLGAFRDAYPRYQSVEVANYFVTHAHNDYLELTAEMGLTGMLAALLCATALFVFALKKLSSLPDSRRQSIGFGALSACFAVLIHSVTDFNLHIPSNALLFAVCAAMGLASAAPGNGGEKPPGINISIPKRWKLPACLATLMLCIAALATAISPYLGDNYMKKAREHRKARDLDRACENLQKAVALDPGNAEHLVAMGDLLAEKSAYSLDPAHKKKFVLESLKHYRNAIAKSPIKSYYYSRLAFALLSADRLKEAEEAFKTAVCNAPMSAFAHYYLAEFYTDHDESEKAYEEYKVFLRLRGSLLTNVLDKLRAIGMGYKDLKKVVPEVACHRKKFAAYLLQQGEIQAAADELEYAFLLEPTPQNAFEHLRALEKSGQYLSAIDAGETYLLKFEDDTSLQKHMASMFQKTGSDEKAADIYRLLIKATPDDASLYIAFAKILQRSGKSEEAISVLEAGLEHNPDESKLYFNLALCYRRMKRNENALIALKKARFLNPGNITYVYQLGEMYRRIGLLQEAVDTWKVCNEMNPEHAKCNIAIEKVYRKLGMP